MSQSDYIKYKKIATEIRVNNLNPSNNPVIKNKLPYITQNITYQQPAVFTASDYENYKQYSLENQFQNTKPVLNRITLSGNTVIFDMEKNISGCPTIQMCSNTQTRNNRIPLSKVYFDPVPQPLNIRQRNKNNNLKNECKCTINKVKSQSYLCSCKTSYFGIVR